MNPRYLFLFLCGSVLCAQDLPANRWTELRRDPAGARPGSAIRYASDGRFFLWGYQNHDPNLPQEFPLMAAPEYDMVAFDPDHRVWMNQLPPQIERELHGKLPFAYIPRTYSGITTGSERTVMRSPSEDGPASPRPDLNIVFDQVAYRPSNNALYYFTGGLTAIYDIGRRRWRDLRPKHSPPPVLGGSMAYDPAGDRLILFGGGHVAERGADGVLRGYTGTWLYSIRDNDWRRVPAAIEPPPRMATRMVCDTKRQTLVLFGGDGQTAYLGDTWIFDLKTLAWRPSRAPAAPPARAGHFTVYDTQTGLVMIGGGHNRRDLADMWAYDGGAGRWSRVPGEVPTGFYLTADLASERRLLVLATSTRTPDDRMRCNILFPVRTTYAYRIGEGSLGGGPVADEKPASLPKRAPVAAISQSPAPSEDLPTNRWTRIPDKGWVAPARTWGSAAFDSRRERILYWGGGHCGYQGSDVDEYDVAASAWIPAPGSPSYPERLWNHGVRLAGVTFDGEPWVEHGRRIYAYDPVGGRLIMVRAIRLTAGYAPDWLLPYPEKTAQAPDALVSQGSSYNKFVTWVYNPESRRWSIAGPAPAGLDTLVTTPLGVMGVPVNWPGRLNDTGYQLPWSPSQPPEDNAVYLFRNGSWERVSAPGPSPQNLYEMTGLAWDGRRERLLLHGAGAARNEMWALDWKTRRWQQLNPRIEGAHEAPAPAREAIYIPEQDTFLIYAGAMWAYAAEENTWRKLGIAEPQKAGQNRAMVYDQKRDLVLLVLGPDGNDGKAVVYGLRYRK